MGSICFAPMALMLPPVFFLYDWKTYNRGTILNKFELGFNGFIFLIGLFFLGSGTYGTALSIKNAYASGLIGGVFSCANNAV